MTALLGRMRGDIATRVRTRLRRDIETCASNRNCGQLESDKDCLEASTSVQVRATMADSGPPKCLPRGNGEQCATRRGEHCRFGQTSAYPFSGCLCPLSQTNNCGKRRQRTRSTQRRTEAFQNASNNGGGAASSMRLPPSNFCLPSSSATLCSKARFSS